MKTIGLIGGMSWESTATYYQVINETVKERLGGFHSAKCILYSVDFAEIEEYQERGDWEKSGEVLAAAALSLEKAGADFVLICTNTMHKVAPRVQAGISIPLIHIADATADELIAHGISKAALLGTKYTMTEDFYISKLTKRGIEVLVPEEKDIELLNSVIIQELCLGIVSERSRQELKRLVQDLSEKGAQAAVLGCTELGLLLKQEDTRVPLFDTALIHAARAAELSME
jgi:aspartate racemase